MPKISALPPMTAADGDDEAPIVDDSATTTKKFTLTVLKEWLQALTSWITTAMITNDAITDAKLIYGKIRSRQGGSATAWNTVGATTYDYSGTDVFIQCGANANNASPDTITFPTAFSQTPLVIAVVSSVVGTQTFAVVLNPSTTTFQCQVYDHAGATNTAQNINWIAIGV